MHTKAILLLLLCALVDSNAKFICWSRSCGLLNTTFLDEATTSNGIMVNLTARPNPVVLGNTVTLQANSDQSGSGSCRFEVKGSNGEFVLIDSCAQVQLTGSNISKTAQCNWPVTTTGVAAVFSATCSNATTSETTSNNATVSVLQPELSLSSSTDTQVIGDVITLTATASVSLPHEEGKSETLPLSSRNITFTITSGSGTLSLPPQNLTSSGGKTQLQPPARKKALTNELKTFTDDDGVATAQLLGTQVGVLHVSAILQTGTVFTKGSFGLITINPPEPLNPLVASVSLTPTLTEAHLGEPVSLTATALDAGGNPFPGAKVCLVSAGRAQLEYYYPHSQPQRPVKSLCGVTDTQGRVTLFFTSKIPGTVGVVAAALQSGRGSVVSAPSHVMFWGHEREQGDYDRREGWWRDEENGAAATQLAMQAGTPATRALP